MPSGRTRQFDSDDALDRALDVFWRRGYEGATLDELTAAMGINRPSLYAAFGNKAQLFRKALERYRAGPVAYVAEALREPTARAVAEALLRGAVGLFGDAGHPRGCLAVGGALACGADADPVRTSWRPGGSRRSRRSGCGSSSPSKTGTCRPGRSCAALARYVATVIHGLAVQSAGGATRAELGSVAALAMRAWPG